MTQVNARTDKPFAECRDGVVVRRPRDSDAIGHSLRKAFAPESALPCDWIRSLDALR